MRVGQRVETLCRSLFPGVGLASISGCGGDAKSPLRPYGALLCLGAFGFKVHGKPSAPFSGPASRDSLAPALLRGSPQRAIPGPVRLTRHPCRAPRCAMPALGRPQVAIVSPMRSAHIHLPRICGEPARKCCLIIRNAVLLLLCFSYRESSNTTAPERGNPCEAGAGRQRRMVSSFAETKDSTVRAKPQ